jgi:murein DD-endopeptidase MepM/ murein hydrolase activator NlpD
MVAQRLMRLPTLLAMAVFAAAPACSRPVLYYPTPESAPDAASRPARGTVIPLLLPPATTGETASLSDADYLRYRRILLPVAGADMTKVEDTFNDGRDGGDRTHHALDILAPRGTPILSADDGRILRMTSNSLGGITVYAVDPQNRLVYYYAHLDHYNDAMSPGRTIVKGDTLGFVGTTGNAPKDTPHLHFQVMRWPADGKYWNGEPIDPYDALGGLMRGERAKRGTAKPDEY